MSDSKLRYDGFISYSRYDLRAAQWLQGYIESRRIPPSVRRQAGLTQGQRLRIFRDETDLGVHPGLNDALREKLNQSRFLIVVCSPYAVASKYVESEIEYFLSLGRADRILCVIAGGDPDARGPLQCFPDALLAGAVPLAADLRSGGSSYAAGEGDKILAPLLGITPRELSARESIEARRRKFMLAAAAALTLFVAVASWDYFLRTHTEYFRATVMRHGRIEGVGKLSADEARGRLEVYEFLRIGRAGMPTRIDLKRGIGNWAPEPMRSLLGSVLTRGCHKQGAFTQLIEYRGAEVQQITWMNPNGLEYEKLLFPASASLGDFREGEFGCTKSASGIKYVRFEQKPDGSTERRIFLDSSRQPARNEEQVFGYEIRTDARGLEVSVKSLGPQGEYWADSNGVYETQIDRNSNGDLIKDRYLDLSGKKMRGPDWCAEHTYELDDLGNSIKVTCLDTEGRPTPNKRWFTSRAFTYDDEGRVTRVAYFDGDGKPVRSEGWVSEVRVSYMGSRVRESYFDPLGKATTHKEGYSVLEQEFDSLGNAISQSHFDAEGRPVLSAESKSHLRRFTLDWAGREIASADFGADGQPAYNEELLHIARRSWNDRGQISENSLFGVQGEPAYNTKGYVRWVDEFDDRGNSTRSSFFDSRGGLALNADWGAAIGDRVFDEAGNLVKREYRGFDGSLMNTLAEVASVSEAYDVRGRFIQQSFLDVNGKSVVMKEHGAKEDVEWGPHGITRVRRFGTDGRRIVVDGDSGHISTYDDRGLEVRVDYLNVDDSIEHSELRDYDARGLWTQVRYVDGKGRPKKIGDNAGWRKVFDDRGLEIEVVNLDEEGGPTVVNGIAMIKYEYDERGRITRQSRFDVEGRPTADSFGRASESFEYDARGNKTKWHSFGPAGPILDNYGIHSRIDEYDNRDRLLSRRFLGVDGSPVAGTIGYAGRRQKYDDRHHEIERVYFGLDGSPALWKDVKPMRAIEVHKYNQSGLLEFEVFYDRNGHAVEQKPGVFGTQYLYTAGGSKESEEALSRERLVELKLESHQSSNP